MVSVNNMKHRPKLPTKLWKTKRQLSWNMNQLTTKSMESQTTEAWKWPYSKRKNTFKWRTSKSQNLNNNTIRPNLHLRKMASLLHMLPTPTKAWSETTTRTVSASFWISYSQSLRKLIFGPEVRSLRSMMAMAVPSALTFSGTSYISSS